LHQADKKGSSSANGDDAASAKNGNRKDRRKVSTDVGRALRTVYDDTLRENVPDDFMDLLGKLS
jgi:hypothetical protein